MTWSQYLMIACAVELAACSSGEDSQSSPGTAGAAGSPGSAGSAMAGAPTDGGGGAAAGTGVVGAGDGGVATGGSAEGGAAGEGTAFGPLGVNDVSYLFPIPKTDQELQLLLGFDSIGKHGALFPRAI